MATAIPAPYRGWVATAAARTGLPASLVAAQINEESGFNPRATSPVGAQGIAQFMPGTWKSQGVPGSPYDPNAALQGYVKLMSALVRQQGGNVRNALAAYNAGPGNLPAGMGYADTILRNAGGGTVNAPAAGATGAAGASYGFGGPTVQFDQAAFDRAQRAAIAGQYLQQQASGKDLWQTGPKSTIPTGSLIAPGLLTTKAPNASDYQTATAAHTALQALAPGTPLSVHPNARGDVNPIAGATIGRTDMGVDANLKPGASIVAPNDAKVVAVIPNWYSGQPYVAVQLLKGANAGKVMYVAEQISGVPPIGTTIRQGQPITRYASNGTGIEIGWANPRNPTQTLAQGTTGYREGQATAAGANFRSWLGGF
jgi:hypothetical protein